MVMALLKSGDHIVASQGLFGSTVITSYSIHYTKLYEDEASAPARVTAFLRDIREALDRIGAS